MPTQTKPSFSISLGVFLSTFIIIITGVFVLEVDLHPLLVLSLVVTASISKIIGYKWEQIQSAMVDGVSRAMSAMFIFIMIGMIIGSWIECGTVPALVYYGLEWLNPRYFLPLSLILCALMSLATGTSWGTAGTIGIALISIGGGMGIPLPIIAGVIISGASFGDKMSPISDTTNLAAISAKADLYDHIKAMMLTTVPTFLICLVLYTIIGMQYSDGKLNPGQIQNICETLDKEFAISWVLLIPMIVLLVLSLSKVPALPAMFAGVVAAGLISILTQGSNIKEVLTALNYGYKSQTGLEIVDKLLNRGGIQSMMWTFSLAVVALALGGILEKMRFLEVLVEKITSVVKGAANLIAVTIASSIGSNMAMGEGYLSIILNGSLYHQAFEKENLRTSMLSRSLEEGATLSTAIIPWTTAGAFFAGTLGVSTLSYLPYAFLNWINPLLSIALAYLGIFVLYKKEDKKEEKAD